MQSTNKDLWLLPLGGCGEIGMNLNLYGHDNQWLMVDCGVTFEKNLPGQPNRIQMADPDFIVSRRQQLVGMVITHGHEDHIGAVPYLWSLLLCPVYCTPFAAQVLRRKLKDLRLLDQVPIIEVDPTKILSLGSFDLQWVPLTHSIPEPYGLMIECAAGRVFHTADWKLDPNPILGAPFKAEVYQALAAKPVTAMVCDSTNAMEPGHSQSEGELLAGLEHYIAGAKGRVVVSCFASNLARIASVYRIALAYDRQVSLLGRSLLSMLQAAKNSGHWQEGPFVPSEHLGYLPASATLVLATGSQGEANAVLAKLAFDRHADMNLEPGDRVILSSKTIPGNEESVQSLLQALRARDIEVIDTDVAELPIHASGHPCQDELKQMYAWVQPKISVPVHGEPPHLQAHADLAKTVGVPHQLLGRNGDLFILAPLPGIRRQCVPTGRLEWLPGDWRQPGELVIAQHD